MNTKQFRKTVDDQCRQPKKGEAIQVVDDLEIALARVESSAKEIGLAGDEINGVKNRLIEEAQTKWMTTRYAVLDMSFADQSREVHFGRVEDNPRKFEFKDGEAPGAEYGTLPVFVTLWDSLHDHESHYDEQEKGWRSGMKYEHYLGTVARVRVGRDSFPPVRVEAVVSVPSGIDSEMFKRVRKCISFLRMFGLATFERGIERSSRREGEVEVGVLWCPTEESWSLKDEPIRPKGDPAVLVRHNKTVYLVGYFDTPDEKPIDNIIREFTSGKIGKALPKRGKR